MHFGFTEGLVILALILLIIAPKQLPKLIDSINKAKESSKGNEENAETTEKEVKE